MRKSTILLLLLCLHMMARGQTTGFLWHYWYDDAEEQITSLTIDSVWHYQADVQSLSTGFHTLYMVVADSLDRLSAPVARHFFKMPQNANGEKMSCLCYVDGNEFSRYEIPANGAACHWLLDMSDVSEGIHHIQVKVVGMSGTGSTFYDGFFIRCNTQEEMKQLSCLCYVDDSLYAKKTITDGSGLLSWNLDMSNLSEGVHRISIQALNTSGAVSTAYNGFFLRCDMQDEMREMTCLSFVDDSLYAKEIISSDNGILHWELDASKLGMGLHRLQVQTISPSGMASAVYNSFFLRLPKSEETGDLRCIYVVDNDAQSREAVDLAQDGTFHFDLDMSSLDNGIHRISYYLGNDKGFVTQLQSRFFIKAPAGEYGITKYEYWLNDSTQQSQAIDLTPPVNPFKLISLLPVPSHPLRSSQFHFEISNGIPMVYAKNDIHVRFSDNSMRFTDVTKQFVDYSVKQEVTDVTLLESDVRQTITRPEANTIKWYKVEAEVGDSLQFRLDRAATIQLFSQSGKELYSASGAESTKWGGCHAEENGTFYVALHDVTATQGTTISIDYEHIGKYAVLAFNPSKFSSDGTTIMYFKGNGLEFVKSVELISDETVLRPDTIISKTSDMLVRFGLTEGLNASKKFNLNILFDNEGNDTKTIQFANAVTLEPVNKGDIAIEITSERRVGDPYPIKVTLKNKGNVGYYGIPMDVAFDNPDRIDEFRFVNFDMLVSDSLFELRDFFTYTDNLIGTNKKGFFMPMLIPYLGPYEERTFIFGVKTKQAHAKLNFYAWTGEPWYDGTVENAWSRGAKMILKAPPCTPSNIPDVYDAINTVEDIANLADIPIDPAPQIARNSVGTGEAIGGIVQGLTRARENAVLDAYNIPEEERDDYRFQFRYCARSPMDIIRSVLNLSRRRAPSSDGSNRIDRLASANCPNPKPHPVDVYIPGDPNEITGYLAESGSHAMTDDVEVVSYDIEFENDPELANSSAHKIVIENELDPTVFDISSFVPKDITLSNKKVELAGDQTFVTTIDLRTAINAIAELRCDYNTTTGKIKWVMTSLNPMTMEPTDDIMQGLLPINNSNGDGMGHVTYSVNLRKNLSQGTVINNKASIVFDSNDAIETPTWTNVIDRIAPESHVTDVQMLNDSTASVSIEASDELSGPWRYDVYVQYGSGAWFKAAENVPVDTTASVKVYEGINHGFYVVVTDSAGNVEQKEAAREFTFEVFGSQMDTNTKIELAQGWNWISHNQQEPLPVAALQPAGSRMVGQVEELIEDTRLGWMGDLEELQPTQMYKLQMDQPLTVQLSGRLFNAGFRSIPLYEGWNWMGYPVANTMTPTEALSKLEAEEGDMLIGQDGMATYNDGQWQGTLMAMNPGQGYMYRSASDKNLFLNATAQASSRRNVARRSMSDVQYPDGWTVDKRKYPNVMGMIGQLWNGSMQEDVSGWVLAAFCGDECRGIGQTVGDVLMMNVYGNGGEQIGFRVMNMETGEVLGVSSQEAFRPEVLGTMAQPYELHIGDPSGMQTIAMPSRATVVYDLMGRRLQPSTPLGKGVYVVTDAEKRTAQKVIRK